MSARPRRALNWADLPLRTKGLVVITIPLIALLVAIASFYVLQSQQALAEQRVQRTLQVRANIQQVHTTLFAEETWLRARLLAQLQGINPSAIRPLSGGFPNLRRVLDQMEELLGEDATQLDRLRRIKLMVERELSDLAYATAERPGEKPPPGKLLPARLEEFLIKSQVALDEISLQLGYMQDEEDRKLTDFTAAARGVRRLTLVAIAAGAFFGLGGGLLAVLLFTAGVVDRVHKAEQNAGRLAEGMPLLPVPETRDEVGRMGRALEEARALLVRREEAMIHARDEAERANQAKSTFLANVSHELRTPLNAILGFTRIVLRKSEEQLQPLQQENLQKVLISADHLLNVINGLLDLSKIEAGKMEIYTETFRLSDVLTVAVAAVEPTLNDGVALVQDVKQDIPPLHTDREKLRQIVVNLLGNAAKFTERGEVKLSASQADGMLQLIVSDTGIGIPADAVDRIFEAFQQADMSSTRRFGGTGLGLAIAKRFVEMLGGTIRVDSRMGEGSRFTVGLPLRYEPQEGLGKG